MQEAELKNVAVSATANAKFCEKWGKSASEIFQMTKQMDGRSARLFHKLL